MSSSRVTRKRPTAQAARRSAPNPQVAAWKDALRVGRTILEAQARVLGLPGFQVSVSVDGKRVGDIAWGLADRENAEPLTPTTLMRVASHSKSFTATLVLQLVEQGVLALSDPLSRWVPELKGEGLGGVTLSELLSHSAGVTRDGLDSDFWTAGRPFPDRRQVLQMARAGKILARNERFKYSNLGTSLLGLVIEAATGKPYGEAVTGSVVGPLKLKHTAPELDALPEGAVLATGYTGQGLDLANPQRRVPIEPIPSNAMRAATGFCSTARDLCRFFSAHLLETGQYPRKRVRALLSDDSKRLAQKEANRLLDRGYGLGFMTAKIGEHQTFGHSGGYPGFTSRTWGVQETGVVLSVICNATDGPSDEFGRTLFTLAAMAMRPADASLKGVGRKRLRRFEGQFANLWGHSLIAVLGRNVYDLGIGGVDPDEPAMEYVDSTTLLSKDTNGFGAHGERVRFEIKDGRAVRLRTGNGSLMVRSDDFTVPSRVALAGK